jgi:hypothetical protein
VVEVVVCQKDMTDLSVGDVRHVLGDLPRFGQRRAAVDQHGPVPAVDEAHGDVQKWETTAEHAVGKSFPGEGHCPRVSGCAALYCSSTRGVGSAV